MGSVSLGNAQTAGSSVAVHVPMILNSNLSCPNGMVNINTLDLGTAHAVGIAVRNLNISESLTIDSGAKVVWDTQ
jgi:hypothetical protein